MPCRAAEDGRLLRVHSTELRVREGTGLVRYADLSAVTRYPFNDITVDLSGTAYVNSIGIDLMGGEQR